MHSKTSCFCAAPALPGLPASTHRTGRLLLVDDDITVRQLIAEALTDEGHVVTEADRAAPALELLRAASFDLLITDLGLPGGMTGQELAAAAIAIQPTLKLLAITGYANRALATDSTDKNQLDILAKPFKLDALCARVAAHLA
jgi:DNA-binding NtrC family response regulator